MRVVLEAMQLLAPTITAELVEWEMAPAPVVMVAMLQVWEREVQVATGGNPPAGSQSVSGHEGI